MITFEEANQTLQSADIQSPAGTCGSLIPYLIWHEIILGKKYRTVFINGCLVTDMLTNQGGIQIRVPILGRQEFTPMARQISEANLDTSGLTKDKISPEAICIDIGNVTYLATRISDILMEDSPRQLDWVRSSLQKMGDSIATFIDTAIRNVLIAGAVAAGNVSAPAAFGGTNGTLAYNEVVKAKAVMRSGSMWESEGGPFMLFLHPTQEADLLVSTTYQHAERYTAGDIPFDPFTSWSKPSKVFAGTRVFVTDNMVDGLALIVTPPTHQFGPACIFAWKRHLKAESWRDEQFQRNLWALSCRYGLSVIQDNGLYLISGC